LQKKDDGKAAGAYQWKDASGTTSDVKQGMRF